MRRGDMQLAVCAIAFALLAGASGAVAAADPDSAGTESTNSSDSDSAADPSADHADHADHADASTYSSGEDARTAGDQSGDVDQNNTGGAEESGDEQGGEKEPVDDSGSDDDRDSKTVDRMPVLLIPEAPPIVDLPPLPEELPPPPLEPVPPPVDLPPAIPGAPVEPDSVDVTTVGPSASRPEGNEPPTLTVPIIVARVPLPPRYIPGASVAPRGTSGGPAVTSTSRWAGEPAPPIRQPATSGLLLREPPPSNLHLPARGQVSNRTGYNNEGLSRVRLSEMAAGALPGVAGIVIMTASGVCLGYRQATAGQQLRTQGANRFLA